MLPLELSTILRPTLSSQAYMHIPLSRYVHEWWIHLWRVLKECKNIVAVGHSACDMVVLKAQLCKACFDSINNWADMCTGFVFRVYGLGLTQLRRMPSIG